MPARDAQPGQVDTPAIPASHHAFIDRLQARNDAMGLEVTVNRGRVYAAGGAQDTVAADQVEDSLRTTEVSGEGETTYKVTVNRGGGSGVGAPQAASEYAAREQMYSVDQPAPPGSKPIIHDPMTEAQRKAATRAAAMAYADRKLSADETAEGEERPGVVMVKHGSIAAHLRPGEIVSSDRLVGAPLVVDSDSALEAEREEAEVAAVVRRDAAQVRADQEAIASAQPETTEDATVDEQGRTVASSVYADRMAKMRAAKEAKRTAAAKPAAKPKDEESS